MSVDRPVQMTVVASSWGATLSRWWPWGLFAVEATLLAVMLYFDRQYHVADAFPLRHNPTPPFIAFLMLGTIGFPFGTGFVLNGLRDVWRAAMSEVWPTLQGRVLKSEVSVTFGKGPRNLPEVSYEYEVGGRRFEGNVIRFEQGRTRFYGNAQDLVSRYPVGSEVPVHYDPENPALAVLDTSPSAVYRNIWMGIVWVLFPFLGFFQFFRDIMNG